MSASTPAPLSQAAIRERYKDVRAWTERLCAPLSAEDQMVQSMPEASPAKWHQAHTTWFFETFVLKPHAHRYRSFHPGFEFLFNSYYVQVGERPERARRGQLSRPSLDEVRAYRARVDAALDDLLARTEARAVCDLVELGLEHEQQHQELIVTDVKHALWSNPLRPSYGATVPRTQSEPASLEWRSFGAGMYEIGHSGPGFAFDNERPRHAVYLHGFELASRLVTNGEYLQFVRDGGYGNPLLWLSDGFDTAQREHWCAPLYWEQRDGEWFAFTHAGLQPLDPHAPVCHVSFYEADAFARWAGARLPLESEWEVAAESASTDGTFLESERFLPAAGGGELAGIFGEAWQWTASAYAAYPGYTTPAGALGEYNAKFMCNQLVLRGGSCATPRSHIRATYRNFFPPQARWQFSGIRLARNAR